MRAVVGSVAAAAMLGLAGCVGAPAPDPVAYQPYAPPVAGSPYGQPGGGYAPGPGVAPGAYQGPSQVAYGAQCYAGVYTCQLPQALPVGAGCACPGLGAPSYGNVR